MKSNTYRKLTESDGISYQFDADAFSKLVRSKTLAANKEDPVNKHKQADLIEHIADKVNLSTDAVWNWKKKLNGPSSLDFVKAAAEVLGVNYFRLLKTIPEVSEITTNSKDAQLVREVFAGLVEIHYEIKGIGMFPDDQRLDTIHSLIDQHLLDVSEETTTKLHRLVIDIDLLFKSSYFSPWNDFDIMEFYMLDTCFNCETRAKAIHCFGYGYIKDELEFAKKYGLERDYVEPLPENWTPDDMDEEYSTVYDENGNVVSEETLAQFGLIYDRWENICDEIPKRIATEKFVGILKKVFQITFPSIIL